MMHQVINGFRRNEADPYWSNVVLLLGFDGADGATSYSDESPAANGAATFHNQAQLDTAQSKFGGSSLLLDGSDKITFADDTDWDFGAGDWTIEAWVRFSATTGFQTIFGRANSSGTGTGSWMIDASGGNTLRFRYNVVTDGQVNLQGTWNYVADTWYHICGERSGNAFRVYADGVEIQGEVRARDMADSTIALSIGSLTDTGSSVVNGLNGWLDEVRITKGVARYGGAFTPPTAAFPRS